MSYHNGDYEYHDFNATCSKCGDKKAYVWFDKRLRIYWIRCDSCGVREVSNGGGG